MNLYQLRQQITVAVFVLVFLVSCSAPMVTPIPTSVPPKKTLIPTPTSVPPTATLIPTPLSPAEAMGQYSLEVQGGDSAETILMAYGKATVDEMDQKYSPPTIRNIFYPDLGLKFKLNNDQLYSIEVSKPYTGKIFGLSIGDDISQAIAIYGDYETDGKSYNIPRFDQPVTYVSWPAQIPNWFFVITDTGSIVEFDFIDQNIYGNWIVG